MCPNVKSWLFNSHSIMKIDASQKREQLQNMLNLVIIRMLQIPEEGVNRKNLEVPRTKKSMCLKINQNRQTKHTIHSKKSTKVDTTQNQGRSQGNQQTPDTEMKVEEEKKSISLTCKGNILLDQLLLEMKCCQQTERQK